MRIQFCIKISEISGIYLPRKTKVAQNENLSLGHLIAACSLGVVLFGNPQRIGWVNYQHVYIYASKNSTPQTCLSTFKMINQSGCIIPN